MPASGIQKKIGPFPVWGWGAAGVLLFVVFSTMRGAKQAVPNPNNGARISGNNGNREAPNIFFLPNGTNPAPVPSTFTINVNRGPGNGGSTNQPSPPPAPPAHSVTVKKWPGNSSGGLAEWDTTLWGIANHFGTTVSALAALNHISNPNLVYPGQVINLP